MKKNIISIVLLVFVLLILSSCSDLKSNDEAVSDDSYKPMIKVDDEIYYWDKDVDIDVKKLEKIGKIEKSYNSLNKRLTESDLNFTSNANKVGEELYRIDKNSVLLQGDGFKSIFKNITEETQANISIQELIKKSSAIFLATINDYDAERQIINVQNINTLAGYVEEKGNIRLRLKNDLVNDDRLLYLFFVEKTNSNDVNYNVLAFGKSMSEEDTMGLIQYSNNVYFEDGFEHLRDMDELVEYLKVNKTAKVNIVKNSIQIVDSNNENVKLSKENSKMLIDYLKSAISNNNECEKVKYLFTNQIYYIDEQGKENHFRFLSPYLVESEKESMLFIQNEELKDKCIKISINFYEELKKIEENTKADFKFD